LATASAVSAQSPHQSGAVVAVPPFLERRSRPRHGTIKLIEDVVYRAMREEAQRAAQAQAPPVEPPPTLAFYSVAGRPQRTDLVMLGAFLEWVTKRSLRPAACKFFCLITGKLISLTPYSSTS